MRSPRDFLKPLALGAPDPVREIPVKPSRCIHFFDPSNPKMAAKLPEVAKKTDILLGNLEDAVPVDRKEAARAGLIRVGKDMEPGEFLDHAYRNFADAAAKWLTGDEPFTAKLNPAYAPYGDYDQLMRLQEWYGRK